METTSKSSRTRQILTRRNITLTFSIFFVAFVVTFLSFSIFTPISSSDAATVTANIESSGYKITVKSSDVAMNLTTTPTGATTFAKDTIVTNTNSPSGFKLYTSMAGESSALYQDGDSASSNFISPTAGTFSAPDALVTNSWGISTAAITTGSESTFWGMPPISSPQLIQTTNSANTSMSEVDGTKKDIYYGIKANFATKSGSYSGTIAYTAAANASPSGDSTFTISPNISENGSLSGGDIVTILTTLYTNYALSGSDVSVTIGGNSCPVSSVYTDTDQGTVAIKCTTPASSTYGLKDVVVNIPKFDWNATLTNGFNYGDFWSITYMQDMNSAICNTVYTPSNVTGSSALIKTSRADYTATTSGTAQVAQRTLYDYRGIDGTGTASSPATGSNQVSYTVRKLADGNCWMTDNLKLTLSTSTTIEASTNSGGTTSWTPTGSSGTSNAATPMNGNTTCTGSGTSKKCWYNWYAATAGSGTEGQTNTDAPRSICPKNWRLPSDYSISNIKSYGSLLLAYLGYVAGPNPQNNDYIKLESSPLDFSRPGNYNGGSLSMVGSNGGNWSATANSDSALAYRLIVHSAGSSPGYVSSKFLGFQVRCVAI